MIADEKILLRQLKEGSHQAFQRLYESYFDLFYGFIFRLTRSHGLNFTQEELKELYRLLYKYINQTS
jgi:DNA-directed RNA polymerase specialized sigma24 family protein